MKALFLGGDLRQKYACDFLKKNGIDSEYYLDFILDETMKNKIKNATIICFPTPFAKNEIYLSIEGANLIKIDDIFSLIEENKVIFGGKLTKSAKSHLINLKCAYIDFLDLETFQIQNALLSAEGAIYYAKQRLEKSIFGLDIAVLGFGRIGKILAYLLHLQGAKITVCARRESDYAWSKMIGFTGFLIKVSDNTTNLNMINKKYDLIFNTVPDWIMDEKFAQSSNSDTMIIDLASYPYGVDELLVKKYNLNYYRELGIPGRYAPKTAGQIIGEAILNNISIKEE